MRVFILALDGLEYNYVTQWKLKGLLQKTFGKFNVSQKYWKWIKGRGGPYSPLVWGSFITGVEPEVHGITGFRKYRNPFWQSLSVLPIVRRFKGKRRILKDLGFSINPDFQGKRDLKAPTLFDIIHSSIAVDVVGYNMDKQARTHIAMSKTLDEFLSRTLDHFLEKWNRVQQLISHPWKVFMFYVALTDHAGHACGTSKLRTIYQRMNQLSYDLKELLSKDTVFLVVSDHGMTQDVLRKEYGTRLHRHSSHAFYSLNFKTSWKPEDVTDFFPRIIEWTKA